ncbi:MAG: VPLPA-CTERM sorting domain-containing protein [Paracoccaceae bacterium]
MKAHWLQAAAGAAAICLSVSAADAAIYEIDYNPIISSVALTTGTIDIDWSAPAVTGLTADGYSPITVTGSSFSSGLVQVFLTYASAPYTIIYSLTTTTSPGIYALFSGSTTSLAGLLSFGTYKYEEVVSAAVPLPAALPLLAAALGAAGIVGRRRKAA